MTDKEFRRLKRSDLIEIIYEYQKNEEKLNDEIKSLKKKLDLQEMKISKAGSIADAVLELSGIFETAQKTADKYLQKVYEANSDAEKARNKIIDQAYQEAARIRNNSRTKRKKSCK